MVTIGSFRGRIAFTGMGRQKATERFKSILKEILSYAVDMEVKIVIEPLNRYESDFLNTADEAIKLIKSIRKPKLGLVLDTFHMNIKKRYL